MRRFHISGLVVAAVSVAIFLLVPVAAIQGVACLLSGLAGDWIFIAGHTLSAAWAALVAGLVVWLWLDWRAE